MKKIIICLIGLLLIGCSKSTDYSFKSTTLVYDKPELHEYLGKDALLPTYVFEIGPLTTKDVILRIYNPEGEEIVSFNRSDVLPDYDKYKDYAQYIVVDMLYTPSEDETYPVDLKLSLAYVIDTPEPQVFKIERKARLTEFVESMSELAREKTVVLQPGVEYVLGYTGTQEGIYQITKDGSLYEYKPVYYLENFYVMTIEVE